MSLLQESVFVGTAHPLVDEIVGADALVPLIDGSQRRYVNLDNAASTPAFVSVQRAVDNFLYWYSSVHRGSGFKSLVSTEAYDEAHRIVGRFVGADPDLDCVIFGKNSTEAINKLAARFPLGNDDVVICTMMEHHSNDLPWRARGEVVHVRTHADGSLDMEDYAAQLDRYGSRVKLVTTTGASNVTGYMPPIYVMAEMAHAHGSMILVDCAQLAPHRAVDMRRHGTIEHLDFVVLSAHKMYAPFGTGALIGPRAFFGVGAPDQRGGGTIDLVTLDEVIWAAPPDRDEAGSPNVVGAVALATSITLLERAGMSAVAAHEAELTTHALERLNRLPGITIYGSSDPRRVADRLGVLSFTVDGVPHGEVAAILGFEGGIGVRNGCFCAHPYILRLLNVKEEYPRHREQVLAGNRSELPGLVRASFGCYNTVEDVDHLMTMLKRVIDGDYQGDYVVDRASGSYFPRGFSTSILSRYFSIEGGA